MVMSGLVQAEQLQAQGHTCQGSNEVCIPEHPVHLCKRGTKRGHKCAQELERVCSGMLLQVKE